MFERLEHDFRHTAFLFIRVDLLQPVLYVKLESKLNRNNTANRTTMRVTVKKASHDNVFEWLLEQCVLQLRPVDDYPWLLSTPWGFSALNRYFWLGDKLGVWIMKKLCHHLFGKVWFRTGGGVRPRWNQLAEVIVEMVNVVDEAGVRDVKVKTAEYLPCVWSVVRWSALRATAVRRRSMVWWLVLPRHMPTSVGLVLASFSGTGRSLSAYQTVAG